MEAHASNGLRGLTVVAFESRRAAEMAELIRRHGGEPIVAPSMREVPLTENPAARDFLARLEAGTIDVTILLTGVGTRTLVAALSTVCTRERFASLLSRTTIIARGPKPVAALREMGLTSAFTAPEPNTWRELLTVLDAGVPLRGRRVAVQEYGVVNPDLVAALESRGADVLRVPVYRWALPEDTAPLRAAIDRTAGGHTDVALFTSATQVDHVIAVAQEMRLHPALLAAAQRCVVASIGPVASDSLRAHGLPVDLEPEHPKMGHLVAAVARQGRDVLQRKRGVETRTSR